MDRYTHILLEMQSDALKGLPVLAGSALFVLKIY